MIRIFGAVLLAAMLSSAATAQTQKIKPDAARIEAAKTRVPKAAVSSCAQYGAGFVRLPDSDTCVRIGGSVEVGVGLNSGAGR